jgi:hypothetical protein
VKTTVAHFSGGEFEFQFLSPSVDLVEFWLKSDFRFGWPFTVCIDGDVVREQ